MISEHDIVAQAEQRLRELLAALDLPVGPPAEPHVGGDLVLDVGGGDGRWTLVCEVQRNAQPRHIRAAAFEAREAAQRHAATGSAYPVVVAPYISAESGAVCGDLGVGYADLAGNCRLAFGTVYIEKRVAKNPFGVKREQRSLFAPKSARVLRIMLGAPLRDWKVAELADRAGISYGQVSKVRAALLDREWVTAKWGGVRIARPEALLDAWRQAYTPLVRARTHHYTLLHGETLQHAIREACRARQGRTILSSFSAARWLAPYARTAGEYFYADGEGEALLKTLLQLEPAAKGENVTIALASDEGVFQEELEPAPGLRCTGLIQTYLDLAAAGERGAEAAQHLFRERIATRWRGGA